MFVNKYISGTYISKNKRYYDAKPSLFVLKASLIIYESGLIRNLRLISKFLTSYTGQQVITLSILLNISRSKVNQKMKLGQLIKYNMKNTFPQDVVEKLQSWTKYFTRILVFMGNSAIPKKFSFYFSQVFY